MILRCALDHPPTAKGQPGNVTELEIPGSASITSVELDGKLTCTFPGTGAVRIEIQQRK